MPVGVLIQLGGMLLVAAVIVLLDYFGRRAERQGQHK